MRINMPHPQEEVKKVQSKPEGLLGFFQSMNEKRKGTIEFSFGNICSWLWFTKEDPNDTKREILMIADKLDKIEKALNMKEPEEVPLKTPVMTATEVKVEPADDQIQEASNRFSNDFSNCLMCIIS